MCCIHCCCCDSCNRFSSKCIEIFIFIISLISFLLTILEFIYINKEYLRLICYVILICLMFFSFLILLSIMLILIWRYKRTILNNRSKIGEAFSIVGIVVTIIYLICIVSFLSMTYSHYELINHPCQNLERSENEIKYYNYSDYVPTFEDNKEDFCIENPDYRVYTVPVIEYIVVLYIIILTS